MSISFPGGLSVQEAFAVAFLIRLVTTLGCLPGGVLYLSSGFQAGILSKMIFPTGKFQPTIIPGNVSPNSPPYGA
jgi:hypothetical protein